MNQFCGGGIFGISTGESHWLEHASHHAILQAYLHVIRSPPSVICFWSRRIHIHSCKRPRHPMKYMRGDSILCCVESHQLMIPRQFLLPDAITCQKFQCKQWLSQKREVKCVFNFEDNTMQIIYGVLREEVRVAKTE